MFIRIIRSFRLFENNKFGKVMKIKLNNQNIQNVRAKPTVTRDIRL